MAGLYFESFDGAKIYYSKSEKDNKRWLIFLHGLGGNSTAWKKEREYFSKIGVSTLALDLRGHGFSDKSEDESFYKLENFAKDIAILIEKEQIPAHVMVGHCFGGVVAMYFQNLFPKCSKGLILVDTSYKPPFFGDKSITKFFYSHLFKLIAIMPNIQLKGHADFKKFINSSDLNLKRIASDILHTSLKSYLLACQTFLNIDGKDLLAKITAPTLVVEGSKDTIFPPQIAQDIKNRIKSSELDLIEGANHIIVLNNPQQLEESIEKFLKKISF